MTRRNAEAANNAKQIATETRTIEATDELLTLKGLKILYHRNAS